MTVNCPTCETKVVWQPESQFRPFCSERCRLIDLGEWAKEERTISTPIQHSEQELWSE
nr:DNA gyrase inhibitor YacG [Dongshaea marina]